ncbi:hypothetical protein CO051_04700 [Candidatus Roizmanbacteria bacterium CG_4_9_14_0_2_um_filter_39_13]|uniref:DUF3048 domain-containing protein n=2 Tax=Candidatus Roizmaniibacteriota TaxID=1752723 RepID=A0A2M8EXS9_9BACT|nr:MAG: hypothetical protein COY15_05620 [Candidatus Roizmanbacteria bacterium CG_4_10_14_0_2_um_filter_39_12]PJC30956.1 MAG: hypothetical protein CO051_04700 [Candidatus Roizmanbacteria bacterium CG_4_9_14_0_2_um_filter_39_13]PJE61265.1 MAG: hypothetical protein COU87_05525 [Candidatus Roizmanbacteria bacterium CG10_big_fil_rev_8_21_14_0_10_39_12]
MDKKILIVLGVIVYALTTFASYSFFSAQTSTKKVSYDVPTGGNTTDEDGAPKTEPCPLNGKLYSEAQKAKWESRRPLAIMVQNNVEARPQSGLSSADVVHEVVAEGGITRFLTLFYCENPEIVGSVRSARMYFIQLLQGFGENPLYAHVGGANTPGPADALGEIKDLGWYQNNDLDQFAVPFPNYWRDYDRLPGRATEHTVYTNTEKLWAFAAKNRDLTNVDKDGVEWTEDWEPWTFKGDAKVEERGTVAKINFGFWDGSLGSDYVVEWKYDKITNTYLRSNGGKPHIDFNTDKQLSSRNVVVAFADESTANDGYEHGQHLLYDVIGKGDAIVFQNGFAIEGTWKKPKEVDMMRFYDADGAEIELVAGKIWIEILPEGNKVDF